MPGKSGCIGRFSCVASRTDKVRVYGSCVVLEELCSPAFVRLLGFHMCTPVVLNTVVDGPYVALFSNRPYTGLQRGVYIGVDCDTMLELDDQFLDYGWKYALAPISNITIGPFAYMRFYP